MDRNKNKGNQIGGSSVYIIMEGTQLLESLAQKTDKELFASLQELDGTEAETVARILAHLATLDERRAAEGLAYSSLFVYCTRKLGYSEAEAYLRIRAARAARDYPRILTMVACGAISVTAVARISPHLTSENYRRVLGLAGRRTREELDRLIAELAPEPEHRPVIRALSVGSNHPPASESEDSLFSAPTPAAQSSLESAAQVPLELGPRTVPGSSGANSQRAPAGRVLFNFVASEAFRAKFKRAKELLTHKFPQGLPANIFDDALEALLDLKDPWRRMARKEKRRKLTAGRSISRTPGGRFAQA